MSQALICYICRNPFEDNDLTIPLNLDIALPYGRINVTIFQHYICGLKYYLSDLANMQDLLSKDKMAITEHLLDVLNRIGKEDTIQ